MAATDLNTVRETIEARIHDECRNVPPLPVVFQNMPYTPEMDTSWIQCLVTFLDSEFLSQGGTTDSNNLITGLVTINIFTKSGLGYGDSLTIGKRIRDLYNRINISGVYFDPPVGPSVITSPSPEGYFQTQVRVTFETIEDL